MVKNISLLVVLIILTGATAAQARKVYLNGVDISAVRGQTFKQATVIIDSNGDIRIDAPGYKVEFVDQNQTEKAPTKAAPPPISPDKGGPNSMLTKRYFLVTQPSQAGRAQYDFSVTVNGVKRKEIKAGTPQIIMEMSSWLRVGDNEIVITANKNLEGGQKSTSPADEARIMIGTGHEEEKIVKIERIWARMKVNASSLSNTQKRFNIKAK
jgi:hypothetical protein